MGATGSINFINLQAFPKAMPYHTIIPAMGIIVSMHLSMLYAHLKKSSIGNKGWINLVVPWCEHKTVAPIPQ